MKSNSNYKTIFKGFPKINEFLISKSIKSIDKLDSVWRKENLLLKVHCSEGDYVFKKINDKEEETEKQRLQIMKQTYPQLIPHIYFFENNAILLEYIEGGSFFELSESERQEKINFAGISLRDHYFNKDGHPKVDISKKVKSGFQRYRKSRSRFFQNDELLENEIDFNIFKNVSTQPSHNDLNAANLIYGKEIKLIDPSDEGFEDIARDVGRYCASCFFNNYDYYGNDKNSSLGIAEAFLSNFDYETLERAKYFIGESFLSFLNFNTISVPKSTLKELSINLLTKKGGAVSLLEQSL